MQKEGKIEKIEKRFYRSNGYYINVYGIEIDNVIYEIDGRMINEIKENDMVEIEYEFNREYDYSKNISELRVKEIKVLG